LLKPAQSNKDSRFFYVVQKPADDIRPPKAPLRAKANSGRERLALKNDNLASGQLGALVGGGGGGHQKSCGTHTLLGLRSAGIASFG